MEPYFRNNYAELWQGDALELLQSVPDGSVGAVILDPPYSMIPNSFAGKDDGAAGTSGAPVMLLSETLRHTRRVLRDGGVAALLCDWRRVPDVSYIVAMHGLRISTCVAWTRSGAGMGGLFRSSWDPILVLSVGGPVSKDKAAVKNTVHTTTRGNGEHPYEKPVAIWTHLLQRIPETTVLDPFAGSGASWDAALGCGHKWIGFEVDDEFCALMVRRHATRQRNPVEPEASPLFAAVPETPAIPAWLS